jgi:hypothetical protein
MYDEVQRATKEDFSDALSIAVVPYETGENNYFYTDNAEDVMTIFRNDSLFAVSHDSKVSVTENNMEISGADGFRARISATLRSDVSLPGAPLYYRVRCASAATWDWYESPYMATTSVVKSNYLSPLAAAQEPYTLDPDFENNRTVHFNFKIDNPEIEPALPSMDKAQLDFTVDANSMAGVMVPILISPSKGSEWETVLLGRFAIEQNINGVITRTEFIDISSNNIRFTHSGNCLSAPSGSTVTLVARRITDDFLASPEDTYAGEDRFTFVVPERGVRLCVNTSYDENTKTYRCEHVATKDVSAFSGETCLGVASPKEGLFYLYMATPLSLTSENALGKVTLRYYSAHFKNVFVAIDAFEFKNDERIGTVSAPFEPKLVVEK